MRIRAGDIVVGALLTIIMVEPAYALTFSPAPAPVAGLSLGAAALIGAGYRTLRKRFDR